MRTRLRDLCAGDPDVMTWLRDHDLDPHDVAHDETFGPFIEGDHMTVHLYRLNGDGHRYVDPAANAAAVEVHTVTLRRPPPDLHYTDGRPFSATIPA